MAGEATAALGGVTARAGTNIALVKYWGKRDAALNLPAAGSLSLTLSGLGTTTRVRFGVDAAAEDGGDRVIFADSPAAPKEVARVRRFLDLVRARSGLGVPAEVSTHNTVPTASGLASSASGFAALAAAAARAAGLRLPPAALSGLARRGSGSAARSIFGGFVEMSPGARADGEDAVAHPLDEAGRPAWDVRLVVAITATGPKAIGSTEAMDKTARTSPYYAPWVESVPGDLDEARAAVAARDLPRLGAVTERSATRMHASALAADPFLLYWKPATLAAIETVLDLRRGGTTAYFTIDAGPHVKVLCEAGVADAVEAALRATPGVLRTIAASAGPGVEILEGGTP